MHLPIKLETSEWYAILHGAAEAKAFLAFYLRTDIRKFTFDVKDEDERVIVYWKKSSDQLVIRTHNGSLPSGGRVLIGNAWLINLVVKGNTLESNFMDGLDSLKKQGLEGMRPLIPPLYVSEDRQKYSYTFFTFKSANQFRDRLNNKYSEDSPRYRVYDSSGYWMCNFYVVSCRTITESLSEWGLRNCMKDSPAGLAILDAPSKRETSAPKPTIKPVQFSKSLLDRLHSDQLKETPKIFLSSKLSTDYKIDASAYSEESSTRVRISMGDYLHEFLLMLTSKHLKSVKTRNGDIVLIDVSRGELIGNFDYSPLDAIESLIETKEGHND